MRSLQNILLFVYALFFVVTSNQINSSEEKNIDIQSNTLISNLIEEKEIKTVIARGFGSSIESAAQNAAENALTQVVGSFIDLETQIKRQTEIRNGVISRTKIIKKDVREYSQGSIKSFEIINAQQNDSIFNITAKVEVRVDDFKAYIKKLAKIETQIDKNLFSIISTEKSNEKNKFELLKKTLTSIKEGEVLDIKQVGRQEILEDITVFGCKWDGYIKCSDNIPTTNVSVDNFSRRGTIVIPYSIMIKKEFLENAKNVLDNISDGKEINTIINTNRPRPKFKINNRRDYFVVLIDSQLNKRDIYYFKEIYNQNEQFLNQINWGNFPKIKVSLIDKEKQTKCTDLVSLNTYERESIVSFNCLKSRIKIGYIKPTGSRRIIRNSGVMIESYDMVAPSSVIYDKVNFLLIIEPSEEFIEEIQDINLEII